MTRREIPIAIIISRREPRSLTVVELPLRVEAQIARNEFLMIILFPSLLPRPPFFFTTTEFIALHFTRARARSARRSPVRR